MAGESDADPENARAVAVSAVVGGERAAQNERHLHEVIRTRAAALRPPAFASGSRELFQSFFMATSNAQPIGGRTAAVSI